MKKHELTLDILGFTVAVICAAVFRWEARDVIWGLWVSSLCVGYAYIVTAVAAPVVRAKGIERVVVALGGLFMLAFFTFHFGMFHFVHGVFLNTFFPLVPKGKGFPNIFAMLGAALASYWGIVAASFISRVSEFPFRGDGLNPKDKMMKPYANVIRMHILIFVFAGLHAARLQRFALFPILAFYFVPWGALIKYFKAKREARRKAAASDEARDGGAA